MGMGRDLYENYQSARRLFDMCDTIRGLCWDGPKEQLDITINSQPALFLTDLACAGALTERGIAAHGVAGFSLGEIPAACYAGLMSPPKAYEFVSHRARAMQECSEKNRGCMFAVMKLSADDVERVCATLPQAYPVNYNCRSQTVVACAESSADVLRQAVSEHGGKALPLSVSGAFHSPLMDAAAGSVAAYLEKESFEELRIPLYANVTALPYGNPKELLSRQINHPVLWQKTIENMISDGFETFIEVGPGKTLSGLIKKINENVGVYNVSDVKSLESTITAIGSGG